METFSYQTWFAIRYQGAELTLATEMVLPFAVYLVALSVKTFLSSLLNADHRYSAFPVASAMGGSSGHCLM